jgi:DNA-binding LacI/PurR family transcriptional regulator
METGTFPWERSCLNERELMKAKFTLLDLEKESGISKTTISRYLSGGNVSSDKVLKIEKAISDLGYIRNNFAQLLRTSQTNLIAVLIPDLDNPFFLKIIKRLEELAQQQGKTLIIKTTGRSREIELKTIEFVRGFRVEAIFLCRSELDDEVLASLKLDIPIFSLDREFKSVYSIVSDNYKSSYTLTKHLLEHTQRKLMFFSRQLESSSVIQRIHGFIDACQESHRPSLEYRYDLNRGIDFNDLLSFIKNNDIEGVICRNDNEAVKIIWFLNEKTSQNEILQVKICGFDNIALSNHTIPKLTTVDQKIEEMCDIAYDLFTKQVKDEPLTIVHSAEMIIRESSL